uniref:acyl-CoA thioesterase n=1 Tax=Roseivirga sp. TaxID=1964215 RepID=UPI0040472F36
MTTFQGTVYPWNCDHMNHMNVQFYVEKFDQATWNLFSNLGITSKYMKECNSGMVALEQKINYLQEVMVGDNLFISSEVLEINAKTIRFKHEMRRLEGTVLVSVTEIVGLHIDTITRKGKPLPSFVGERFLKRYDDEKLIK